MSKVIQPKKKSYPSVALLLLHVYSSKSLITSESLAGAPALPPG